MTTTTFLLRSIAAVEVTTTIGLAPRAGWPSPLLSATAPPLASSPRHWPTATLFFAVLAISAIRFSTGAYFEALVQPREG